MGGGGYVAGPAGLAASLSGTPLVLTEADSHMGLANRLLARRARRVCLAFPIAGREGERYLVTGRPVPAEVLGADREAARRRFGIAPEARCLFVVGGSQGARSVNFAAVEAFAERDGRDFQVLHLSGRRDHEELRAPARRRAPPRRLHADRLRPAGLGDFLAAADLVLGRSGGSIFELTAAGRPAILVPYPYATADHQSANAAWMERAGAATVVADAELGGEAGAERLRPRSAAILGDAARLRGDGRGLARRWPGPTRRGGSPTRSWRRRCLRRAQARLVGAPAALHRHRRRRDERPGPGLRPARRHRQRQRPQRLLLYGAPARRPASIRLSATTPPTCPRGPRSSSRPRSARTTRSWRWPASAGSSRSTAAPCWPSSAPRSG